MVRFIFMPRTIAASMAYFRSSWTAIFTTSSSSCLSAFDFGTGKDIRGRGRLVFLSTYSQNITKPDQAAGVKWYNSDGIPGCRTQRTMSCASLSFGLRVSESPTVFLADESLLRSALNLPSELHTVGEYSQTLHVRAGLPFRSMRR